MPLALAHSSSYTTAEIPLSRPGDIAAGPAKRDVIVPLTLGALVFPYSAAAYLGDLKLTPIKILIVVLIVPAGLKLLLGVARRRRKLLASDAYALGLFMCMLSGPLIISGSRDFVSAFSQAMEFYGMYLIGRAFLFNDTSFRQFTRSLQAVTLIVVGFGVLDIITQHYVALEIARTISPPSPRDLDPSDPHFHRVVLGINTLRASSTFDHPILFGTFCAAVVPLHLYTPMHPIRRLLLVSCCILGCIVALSSAPLLALFMVFTVYVYDQLLHRSSWRWKILVSSLLLCVVAFSIVADNPLGWFIRNLTLDPQTGYFRLLMWTIGLEIIGNNPLFGVGFNGTGNYILDFSIDSLWLAKTLVYGIPMTTFLYFAALAAVIPTRDQMIVRKSAPLLDLMCKSFSIVLAVVAFVSTTVAFWNAVWLFFAICIGARASLKERCMFGRVEMKQSSGSLIRSPSGQLRRP